MLGGNIQREEKTLKREEVIVEEMIVTEGIMIETEGIMIETEGIMIETEGIMIETEGIMIVTDERRGGIMTDRTAEMTVMEIVEILGENGKNERADATKEMVARGEKEIKKTNTGLLQNWEIRRRVIILLRTAVTWNHCEKSVEMEEK
jgi:hypothetical protein